MPKQLFPEQKHQNRLLAGNKPDILLLEVVKMLTFIAGVFLGANFGVAVMCLMQIAKKSDK